MEKHIVHTSFRWSRSLCLLLLLSLLSVFPLVGKAPVRSLGFGASALGRSGIIHPQETMGGFGLSLAYAPFSLDWFEPSMQVEVVAGVTETGFSFRSVRAGLGFDLFRTLRHPFQFMTNNPSMWSVSVNASALFEFDRISEYPKLYLSLCPLKLKDKDFWYEWCEPYMTLDFSTGKAAIDSWGLVLFRFTFLFV